MQTEQIVIFIYATCLRAFVIKITKQKATHLTWTKEKRNISCLKIVINDIGFQWESNAAVTDEAVRQAVQVPHRKDR